jgi:hypothetical protein
LLLHEGFLAAEPEPTFSESEWIAACQLAFSKKFSEIEMVKDAPLIKIDALFEERLYQT